MAFIEAQARACLPLEYCATRSSWQVAQVCGVGMAASDTSAAVVWPSPWQTAQPTSFAPCWLSSQSVTMFGVTPA